MKVKDLIIDLLENADMDDEVIVASDNEGNSYRTTDGFSQLAYKEYGYEIEVGYLELTSELKSRGYTEEDLILDGKPCIVL